VSCCPQGLQGQKGIGDKCGLIQNWDDDRNYHGIIRSGKRSAAVTLKFNTDGFIFISVFNLCHIFTSLTLFTYSRMVATNAA
jgi:hypothetical protein